MYPNSSNTNSRKRPHTAVNVDEKVVQIMIDLVVVKALVSENINESYVSLELTDEANLVYDSFMEATQINDGLVVGNVLGDADGTLFDGMEEEQFKFYVLEGGIKYKGEVLEVIIGKDIIKAWDEKGYRSLFESFKGTNYHI